MRTRELTAAQVRILEMVRAGNDDRPLVPTFVTLSGADLLNMSELLASPLLAVMITDAGRAALQSARETMKGQET